MRFRSTAPLYLALLHIGLWSLWLLWSRHAIATSAGNSQLEFHWWFWLSHPSIETAFRALKLTNLLVVVWLWSCYRSAPTGRGTGLTYSAVALLAALLLVATRELLLLRPGLELAQILP